MNKWSARVPINVHPDQHRRSFYDAVNDSGICSTSTKHLLKGCTICLVGKEWIILIFGTSDAKAMKVSAILPDDGGGSRETLASRIKMISFAQQRGVAGNQLLGPSDGRQGCCNCNRRKCENYVFFWSSYSPIT